MDYTAYVRDKIRELCDKKGLSLYQISSDLGQNKNYMQSIVAGKSLPSVQKLFDICEYFEITPMQFFDGACHYPQLVRVAMDEMSTLDSDDLLLLLNLIQKFKSKTESK